MTTNIVTNFITTSVYSQLNNTQFAFETKITAWHKKKYSRHEKPVGTPDIMFATYEENKIKLTYTNQFVSLKIQLEEKREYDACDLTVSVFLEKLHSRVESSDYDDLHTLIQELSNKLIKENKLECAHRDAELQAECGIEYARDHC